MPNQSCTRCDYRWCSIIEHPKKCPKCASEYWAKDYVRHQPWMAPVARPPKRPRGHPRRIPQLRELEVGQELLVHWPIGPDGLPHQKTLKQIYWIVRDESRKYGKQFARQGTARGILVRRLK